MLTEKEIIEFKKVEEGEIIIDQVQMLKGEEVVGMMYSIKSPEPIGALILRTEDGMGRVIEVKEYVEEEIEA